MGFEQLAALRDQLRKQKGEQASPETTDRPTGRDGADRRGTSEGGARKADSQGGKPRHGGPRSTAGRDDHSGKGGRGQNPARDHAGGPQQDGDATGARSGGRRGNAGAGPRPDGRQSGPREGGPREGGPREGGPREGGPREAGAPGGARAPGRGPRRESSGKPRHESQRDIDPVVVAISKLQRKFPNAFPKKPAPKLPLKLGVHEELLAQADTLGLEKEEITGAIKTWCQGSRYWACLVEDAPRVDLSGEPAGAVTKAEANRARQLARRQRVEAARSKKRPAGETSDQPDAAATPVGDGEASVDASAQPVASAETAVPASPAAEQPSAAHEPTPEVVEQELRTADDAAQGFEQETAGMPEQTEDDKPVSDDDKR